MKNFLKHFLMWFNARNFWTAYLYMVIGFAIPMICTVSTNSDTPAFWTAQKYLWSIGPVMFTAILILIFYLLEYRRPR